MIERLVDRPIPIPFGFVVKKLLPCLGKLRFNRKPYLFDKPVLFAGSAIPPLILKSG
jgi:hypothetical protein